MKPSAQQRAGPLQLYGLVQGLSYVVRLNDLKTAQHFRARLASGLRRTPDLARPLRGDLKELFEISGLTGAQQFVRVEHVHVNDGGQAFIGDVRNKEATA